MLFTKAGLKFDLNVPRLQGSMVLPIWRVANVDSLACAPKRSGRSRIPRFTLASQCAAREPLSCTPWHSRNALLAPSGTICADIGSHFHGARRAGSADINDPTSLGRFPGETSPSVLRSGPAGSCRGLRGRAGQWAENRIHEGSRRTNQDEAPVPKPPRIRSEGSVAFRPRLQIDAQAGEFVWLLLSFSLTHAAGIATVPRAASR